jgi:hypothetical protein
MTAIDLLENARSHRDAIVALDVAHVDSHTMTLIPIDPETLDARPGAYLKHVTDKATIDELLDLIESAMPVPDDHGAALRWKLTFRDAQEQPVIQVWHHNFEEYGRIGPTQVKFVDDRILTFLHAHFDPED